MYLTDKDIHRRLDELNIVCDNPSQPFVAEDQVQPCSLDLRLSNVFWEPLRKSGPVDLRRSQLLELAPRRYWQKRTLKGSDSIILRSGQLLLGRVYESVSIPTDCAGKVEGRSSFARLGLAVHCTGDFLNPGYRGHMTLQLVNHSPNSIRIFPYLPICQLFLIPLSGVPDRRYGEGGLESKYVNDDGGPSYWWRDKRIRALHETFNRSSIEMSVQEELLRALGVQEPEIVEDFEGFVDRDPGAATENAETLLDHFAKTQDKLRNREALKRGSAKAAFPVLLSVALGSLFVQPISHWHYIIGAITLLSGWPLVWALREPKRSYLGEQELRAARRADGTPQ